MPITSEQIAEARELVVKTVERWHSSGACKRTFSWPDDALFATKYSFHYWLHVGWVKAWNEEGRKTDAAAFLLDWITDDGHMTSVLTNTVTYPLSSEEEEEE